MAQVQFSKTDTALWEEKFGNGSASDLVISANTTDAPTNTTGSTTSGSTNLTVASATGFSVGDLILIHQSRNGGAGAGTWMLNKIANISGVNFTLKYAAVATFDTTCQVQKLNQYGSVTVNAGVTWTASDWAGTNGGILSFLCNGKTTISGSIVVTSKGYRGGVKPAGNNSGRTGEGTSGASLVCSGPMNNGSGGGSATNDQKAKGAGGGNGTAGTNGITEQGGLGIPGGTVSGNSSLTTATFGGGGGSGADNNNSDAGDQGGDGGGLVFIFSKDFVCTGSMPNNGGNGTSSNWPAGGGAGGSTLIKAQTATLGSNIITATGGAPGPSNGGIGTGGVGRIHLDYLTSYTGTTSPTLDATQDNSLTGGGGGGGSGGGAGFLLTMLM